MMTGTKAIIGRVMIALTAMCAVTFQSHAEEPIASDLNVSDIDPKYFGAWDLTFNVEALKRELSMVLHILDVGGKVGATLDSANQPEPLAISHIALVDGRLDMNSELTFGGRITITININSVLDGEKLVGTVKDTNGLLKADFNVGKLTEEQLAKINSSRPAATEARFNIGEKRLRIIAAELKVGNPDWKLFEALEDGQVQSFTLSGATKMLTDFDLHFGDKVIKTENIVEGYPGVYSLWLKKTSDGWNLVFNSQPDIWGTLRKPEYDVAEIPLVVSKAPKPAERYIVAIEKAGDGAVIKMAWGEYQWSAPFKIVQ